MAPQRVSKAWKAMSLQLPAPCLRVSTPDGQGQMGTNMREAAGKTGEPPAARLKRLQMRAWRRGTKEMDLILGPYADARLAGLSPDRLSLLDRLMAENDQDLYRWLTGQAEPPALLTGLLAEIAEFARDRLSPQI